jgi:hypothetical protein
MIVRQLKLANLRAIEVAEFSFRPGFNLIVGVNGVGKSSVLDALRICISRILPSITASRVKTMSFDIDDIRKGFPFLDVALTFELGDREFRFTRLQWRERVATENQANIDRLRREIMDSQRLQDRARNLLRALNDSQGLTDSDSFVPAEAEMRRTAKGLAIPPMCVFFSTNRSVVSSAGVSKGKTVGGTAAAYAEALNPRSWQVAQFADWMRVQQTLSPERPVAARHLDALQVAATRFLPDCEGIRPDDEDGSRLVINKNGTTLDVKQLSDGERGVLAMVLDLARRLSQANPDLDDPLKDGQAIVLIDELDLHLHPKWQRQIVRNLTAAFPQCQFIATTHSPQVIGEVEHDRIQIIANGQVYSPTHSFGVDSSRVLEEIMEADPRTQEVKDLLAKISQEIGKQRFDKARETLEQLIARLGDNDPEITRVRTLLDFMEGNE